MQSEKCSVLDSTDMAIVNIARRLLSSSEYDTAMPYALLRTDRSMGSVQSIEVCYYSSIVILRRT